MKLLAPGEGYGAGELVIQYPTDQGLALEVVHGNDVAEVEGVYGPRKMVRSANGYGTPIEELRARAGGGSGAPVDYDRIEKGVDRQLDQQARAGADQD